MRVSRHMSMFIAAIILAQFACAADKDAAKPTTKPASGAAASDDASAPLRRLPGLEGWPARITSVDGYRFTCEFTQPLHPAVLERVLKLAKDVRD